MVWYSHLLKNFPRFVVIHTVKGFSMVKEADFFFNGISCFFYDPKVVGNLVSGSSAFSKSSLEKAMAPYSSTLAWKIPWTEEPDGL